MGRMLEKFRITARLYGGFGMLVVIGFTVAVVSVWQFSAVGEQVSTLARVSGGMARSTAVASLANDMQRLALRYKISGEEASIAALGEDRAKAMELLQVAIEKSILADRRKAYGNMKAGIEAYQAKFDHLVELTKKSQAARAGLTAGGDQLTTAAQALLDALRAEGDATMLQHASIVEPAVLLVRIASLRFQAVTDPQGPTVFKAALDKALSAIDTSAKDIKTGTDTALLGTVKEALGKYGASFDSFATAQIGANHVSEDEIRPLFDSIQKIANELSDIQSKQLADTSKNATGVVSRSEEHTSELPVTH